jgi:aerobic C4-dicarboxylate transport protein
MKNLHRSLYFWVLVSISIGILLGIFVPDFAVRLKPLGDGFIALVKMLIAPVIFCTVVLGISGAGDLKKVGRVGAKALVYFEVVSTLALAIGLLVANVLKPGHGFNAKLENFSVMANHEVSEYTARASEQASQGLSGFLLHLIPRTFLDAFTGSGDLLQVLLISLLFGFALVHLGERGQKIRSSVEDLSKVFFYMVNQVMRLAPIGAGGAMAYTIGKFGVESLRPLLSLVGCFYLTCFLFITVVLGTVGKITGFNLFKFLRYIKDELLIVLGTSSSESALVPLMEKLEKLGCSRAVVGLVVPTGYSFNLDGTNIYLTLALLFVAQALNIDLSLGQQLSILLVAMLSSKGASGVTGAGFITLAATLSIVPQVPVAGLALILGVDRFMSELRALTNIIGNGVATLVVAKWENELDPEKLNQIR